MSPGTFAEGHLGVGDQPVESLRAAGTVSRWQLEGCADRRIPELQPEPDIGVQIDRAQQALCRQ
jgi:hypothetical protein